jgi:hypothetical protein
MGRKVAVHTNIAGVSHTGHAAHFLVEGVEKPTDNKGSWCFANSAEESQLGGER